MTKRFDSIIKTLRSLVTDTSIILAFISTTCFWFTIANVWPDYRLNLSETITVFVICLAVFYGVGWLVRVVRDSKLLTRKKK